MEKWLILVKHFFRNCCPQSELINSVLFFFFFKCYLEQLPDIYCRQEVLNLLLLLLFRLVSLSEKKVWNGLIVKNLTVQLSHPLVNEKLLSENFQHFSWNSIILKLFLLFLGVENWWNHWEPTSVKSYSQNIWHTEQQFRHDILSLEYAHWVSLIIQLQHGCGKCLIWYFPKTVRLGFSYPYFMLLI